MNVFRVFLRIASRNLIQARRRTLLVSLALGSVSLLLTLLLALSQGLSDKMREIATIFMAGHVNVAGWYKVGERDPSPGQRTNVEGTRNVLAAAQRAGTAKVVHTSTLAVNSHTHGRFLDETHEHAGSHLSEYDRTKAEAHAVAKQFAADGLPVVIVMPGAIYGPGDTAQTGEL